MRLRPLDGLRGIAAVAVVAFHFLYYGPVLYPSIGESLEPLRLARQGVQLFFVISGFVIMMSLSRTSVRRFVASRVARLYPVYWASVILVFVTASVGLHGYDVEIWEAIVNLTMIQSYFGVAHVDGVYWTLAVELAFYVQIAILWFSGALKGRSQVVTLYIWLTLSVALSIAVYAASVEDTSAVLADDLSQAFKWLPYFIAGIAAYLIVQGDRRPSIIVLPVAAWVLGSAGSHWTGIGYTVLPFTALILLVLLWRPLGTTARPVVFLGEISYALYVVHEFTGYAIITNLVDAGLDQWLSTAVAFVVVVAVATAITKWVDKPLRKPIRTLIERRVSTRN